MPSGLAFGVDSALGDPTCVYTVALVAHFVEAAIIVDIAFRSDIDRLALSVVAKQGSVWADTCNGPGRQGVLDNTLLLAKAGVANFARVLTSCVNACKLRPAVSVDLTLRFINNR